MVFWVLLFSHSITVQSSSIRIHLRGVYESKISLIPLTGANALKPVFEISHAKPGEPAVIEVPENMLPGEFVLRFDYKENPSGNPYPSEKRIIVSDQNLEIRVHPLYCNNSDSTWFQKDEKENSAYAIFLRENNNRMQMIGLLQNFLLNYDDDKSGFYKEGVKEYEKRRKSYNQWINGQVKQYSSLFISSMIRFHHIPAIEWEGNDTGRKKSLRDNYFEDMDLSDPLVIRTSGMKEWMDRYVNLFGELATSISLRDSLFTLAGRTAIEKAKSGAPEVYGWMVDYFFNGYESFNIEKGIRMLQTYLNDPNCLTSKRMEINKRLKGIETLIPGTKAPDIVIRDTEDNIFELYKYQTDKKYILILFWSADCSHCRESADQLYSWSLTGENKSKVDVVALSVDETKTEVTAWEGMIGKLPGWIHLRAAEGIRSKAANDYFILGVPVMILIDSKTYEIISIPENVDQLVNMTLLN